MSRLSTFVVIGLVGVAPFVVLGAHRLARRAFRVPGLGIFTFYLADPARAAPRAARLGVRAAGPLALYLHAVILVVIGLLVTGSSAGTLRVDVMEGPARAAGVRDGDRVVAVDGTPVADFGDIRRLVAARGGGPVALRLEREGRETTVTVAPGARGLHGIRSRMERVPLPVGTAVRHALARPVRVVGAMWTQLAQGVSGRRTELVGGPVAVVRMMPQVTVGSAVVYAGDLCGYGWSAFVLVILVATVVGESAGPRRAARPTAPRGSP
ncbi:MAG: PDZ domain-containing protein [Deltaproteobacteria bacterium]|nr:PDZ domain-containing protein [Deltaproteobacteria bacterium]